MVTKNKTLWLLRIVTKHFRSIKVLSNVSQFILATKPATTATATMSRTQELLSFVPLDILVEAEEYLLALTEEQDYNDENDVENVIDVLQTYFGYEMADASEVDNIDDLIYEVYQEREHRADEPAQSSHMPVAATRQMTQTNEGLILPCYPPMPPLANIETGNEVIGFIDLTNESDGGSDVEIVGRVRRNRAARYTGHYDDDEMIDNVIDDAIIRNEVDSDVESHDPSDFEQEQVPYWHPILGDFPDFSDSDL